MHTTFEIVIRPVISILLVFGFSLHATYATPIVLHIDNTHSSIQFSIPFVGITEVNGTFERFCGTFNYDESNISNSRLELFIDASSINTGLRIRDNDLRNDYLEVGKYPLIHFKSTSVAFPSPKNFDVMGDLYLHGNTKGIRLRISLLGDIVNGDGGRELGLKLQPVILPRTDYNIMTNSIGGGTVGDSITVKATIRVRDVGPYRREFDKKYPDAASQSKIIQPGKYANSTGKTILLITYGERNFMSFSDDWMWLSELKSIGPGRYKCTSFNNTIELKNDQVVFSNDDGSDVLTKVE
jgi:polyisoprenoid-binding protein YceI